MTERTNMQITRKKLVKLAFKALKNYPKVSDADRAHMLYAACTMPHVALGNWTIGDDCGCLVGTMLLDEGYGYSSCSIFEQLDKRDLESIGNYFDELLQDALALGGNNVVAVVQVID